jgi:hypothetical protein
MSKHDMNNGLTRRQLLWLSAAGATTLGAGLSFPDMSVAASGQSKARPTNLYATLLQTWCDGLLAHQVKGLGPALDGGLLCPACTLIHGRVADAVYPLLRVAGSSGDDKYLQAALRVYDWSERQVSRTDGSWANDVTLSAWQGITVFRAVAMGEALHHHGHLLPAAVRQSWTDRLARAAKFLDGFMSIETGNINYPITASYCFALCGQVLGDAHYLDRGRALAHTALDYFTPNGLLFGEGHPLNGLTAKRCHPVDLGYNVEESLPALALYSLLTDDKVVRDQVIVALKSHMEFMLPNGAWDNSWGTRNYKWSWWGSRTSDGCQPAYALMAQYDPRFREVAQRNVELMAACTHEGLLYGGPDYFAHGDLPCIHHTFTHAKALATVLDRGEASAGTQARVSLPRDEAYGLKSFPEIGTHLAAVGDWRATVTEYDWEYVEHVQSGGGGGAGGGHASGGALSMLYHQRLGAVLVASMTEYEMIEISNQQGFRDAPHMALTPRVEWVGERTYTSLNDYAAALTVHKTAGEISFDAAGRLLTSKHQAPKDEARYHLVYRLTASGVEIIASAAGALSSPRFILPVVSASGEVITQPDRKTIRIAKPGGSLVVTTDAPDGFAAVPAIRTFNLVPGFECVPLAVTMQPGREVRIRIAS